MPFQLLQDNPTLRRYAELLIKVAILLLLCLSIWYQVFHKRNVDELLSVLQHHVLQSGLWMLLVLVLMPVNWLLESWKWHVLINRTETVRFGQAIKAIFAGCTFTLFTPNRIGEYGGRFIFLEKPLRLETLQATVLGSIAQILVTLILGIAGLNYVLNIGLIDDVDLWPGTVWLTIGVVLALLILYYNLDKVYDLTAGIKRLSKLHQKLATLIHFNNKELSSVLFLSVARYTVYCVQYLILLHIFGVELSLLTGLAAVAAIFLFQTLIPSIAAFDIGIRGNVALFMLGSTANEPVQVVVAAFSLWFINLVLAAIIGYIIIIVSRIFKNS